MYNVHIYVFILRRTANVTVMLLGLLPPILFSEAIFYCSSHLLVSASATHNITSPGSWEQNMNVSHTFNIS